jgi:CTP:molybdopterin cytidylyltransferase MocA
MALMTKIFALILAAGQSKRMSRSKITLPWGNTTVISHIIDIFSSAGVNYVVVVTGGYRDEVEKEVLSNGVKPVYNPDYENDEMLISVSTGLKAIDLHEYSAGFIALGDQPNIFRDDIEKMSRQHEKIPGKIVIPSHSMRRGHPWLIPAELFSELIKMKPPQTMRMFLNMHSAQIEYILSDHAEILNDLDTPEDYERLKPR